MSDEGTRAKLWSLPVGTVFHDKITDADYEVIEPQGEDSQGRPLRYRATSNQFVYSEGAWNDTDEITLKGGPVTSLYERVEALQTGTVFRVGKGSMWLRTKEGVVNLISIAYVPRFDFMFIEIPENWRTMSHPVNVVSEP